MKQGISTSAASSIVFLFVLAIVLLVVGRHYSPDRARYHASGPVEYGTYGSVRAAGLSGPGTGRVGVE